MVFTVAVRNMTAVIPATTTRYGGLMRTDLLLLRRDEA